MSSVECGFGCVFFSLCCCLTWSELEEAVSCSERQESTSVSVRVHVRSQELAFPQGGIALVRVTQTPGRC